MIRDIMKYAVMNLFSRKTRSFLSTLSILIGITAIFALISFGQGINSYMNEFAQEMGSDKIFLMPGSGMANPPGTSNIFFTDDDLDFLKRIKGVDDLTGMFITSGRIEFKDYKEKYTYVMGLSTESNERRLVEDMFGGIGVIDGRGLQKGDDQKVTLGYSFTKPNVIFKRALSVGDKVEINDVKVEVIGFYEEIGNPQDDGNVYMTLDGYENIFGDSDFEYVYIKASPGQDPGELAERMEEKLRKRRDQKEGQEDFVIQTFEDVMATFTNVIVILNGVLVMIALISVVVAAVNIMNTMYTSILERTKEIGVMKSIGAENKFILSVFVVEAGILGLLGGVIGVLLGFLISLLGGAIAKSAGLALLQPAFPWWLIFGCLMFAFLVGAGSGFLPAIQASRQRPVDALRYE